MSTSIDISLPAIASSQAARSQADPSEADPSAPDPLEATAPLDPGRPAQRSGPQRPNLTRVWWTVVGLAAVIVAGGTFVLGWDYFAIPLDARPWDTLHDTLGAGGSWGHLLGIVGSGLMLGNLLYLVRRRWARFERLGSVRAWLAFHVAAGIGGVALVLGHSGGDFTNPIARISTIAAVVVLVTGVLGRWIYGQVSRGEDGEAASEGELVGRLRAALHGIDESLWTEAETASATLSALLPPPIMTPWGAARLLPSTPIVAVRLRLSSRRIRRTLGERLGRDDARAVIGAAREAVRYRLAARRQQGFKALIGAWRGIHRVATFVLILTLVAHVVTLYAVGVM